MFEPNHGQTDPSVKFVARGTGYSVFLTSDEAVLALRDAAPVRMTLADANPSAQAAAFDALPSRSNYFIGRESSRWRANVPNYARVRYDDVYPDIDLVYYGNQRQLEYDFVVAPHADPRQIRVAFDGAGALEIASDGSLVLSGDGAIRFHKPVSYQLDRNGDREIVESRYAINANREVTFEFDSYDTTRALVIDPVLSYATYVGGTADEYANAMTIDASGNAYVVGFTKSTAFPTTAGAYDTGFNGQTSVPYGGDAVIVKFGPTGSLVYSTFVGGSNDDAANAVAVDSAGNVYITGQTGSNNYPITPGAYQQQVGSGLASSFGDSFVTKLNPSGSALVYSTYLSGSSSTQGYGIVVDSSGNAYIAGSASGTFPAVNPLVPLTNNGQGDAFVAKLNSSGSGLLLSKLIGGTIFDWANDIAFDASGNILIVGVTGSANFPTASPAQTTLSGNRDAFVAKLGPTGATIYATYWGGNDLDTAGALEVDSSGNAYVTGKTSSTNFPTTSGVVQPTSTDGSDAFVAKFSTSGAVVFSTFLGGSLFENGYLLPGETQGDIALDGAGNIYVAGSTGSNNFPVANAIQPTRGGGASSDAFVTKLNPTATTILWSTYYGGSGTDEAYGLAVSSAGDAYFVGRTTSTDLPTAAAFQSTRAGSTTNSDWFVAKIVNTTPTLTLTPTPVNFSAVNSGGTLTNQTPAQPLTLTQTGSGAVTWTVTDNQPWLTVTPTSGIGAATLLVSINNTGNVLPATGSLAGTITVSATGGVTSPTAAVNLTVLTSSQLAPPAGVFDTPNNGQTGVTGSIPVTGWAIDDLGVTRVRVWRDPVAGETPGQQIFIGDAVQVSGARPDIQALYPTRPFNNRAGWGYLLLTNFLPNQGNGTVTLYAYAEDVDGRTAALGSKTITTSNASATAPFGAIDTPAQGATVSGSAYINFGWALTPQPKAIATNGSTISVLIDSVSIGAVDSYNNARSDIQALFPGYANTNGAVGVKIFNTTSLTNGVHTIAWIAFDSAGAGSGIGSRYFTVANSALYADPSIAPTTMVDATTAAAGSVSSIAAIEPSGAIVTARRGLDDAADRETLFADTNGVRHLRLAQLEHVAIDVGSADRDGATYRGYVIDGGLLRALPIGSHFDGKTGAFTWMPGLAFGGTHQLVFVREHADERQQIRVDVTIDPHPAKPDEARLVIDTPVAGASLAQPFTVAGWTFDPKGQGAGIDALHVWAYPIDGDPDADPIWIGAGALGGFRPDVGEQFGWRFARSGYTIEVASLPPGAYDLVVYARSTATGQFNLARAVRVTVR